MSDDGAHGITLIAFIGSVFSPYYAWSRRFGGGTPLQHCALNVALYGKHGRWAMTERGARAVQREADWLAIGPSRLDWDGRGLTVHINEVAVPLPRRIRGTLRLYPEALENRVCALDGAGRHLWRPIAPCARAEVALQSPGLSWSGPAYFDTNCGERPLEEDFIHWDWSRAPVPGGTALLYNVTRRDGSADLALAMRYADSGGVEDFSPPAAHGLPSTRWRMSRRISSDSGAPRVIRTLEDAPFYARSIIATQLLGANVTAMHESLSLDRFRRLWVQVMLPFRMPRQFATG
jgi:carotenoid 1,2-hydratase